MQCTLEQLCSIKVRTTFNPLLAMVMTHMQNVKVIGQSIQKIENIQTDGVLIHGRRQLHYVTR